MNNICLHCGNEFTPRNKRPTQKFCPANLGTDCQRKYWRETKNSEKYKATNKAYNIKRKNDPELKERDRLNAQIYWQTPKGRFCHYKAGASQRNLDFNLTFDQFMGYWDNKCHYCGGKINGIGIDRVDNSVGYIPNNCVSCCIICNNMKKDLSQDLFLKQCFSIYKNSLLTGKVPTIEA